MLRLEVRGSVNKVLNVYFVLYLNQNERPFHTSQLNLKSLFYSLAKRAQCTHSYTSQCFFYIKTRPTETIILLNL